MIRTRYTVFQVTVWVKYFIDRKQQSGQKGSVAFVLSERNTYDYRVCIYVVKPRISTLKHP